MRYRRLGRTNLQVSELAFGAARGAVEDPHGYSSVVKAAIDVGTAMNGWIVEHFRKAGLRMACVSTMGHDIAAQKVYEKHGFKELASSIHYSMRL